MGTSLPLGPIQTWSRGSLNDSSTSLWALHCVFLNTPLVWTLSPTPMTDFSTTEPSSLYLLCCLSSWDNGILFLELVPSDWLADITWHSFLMPNTCLDLSINIRHCSDSLKVCKSSRLFSGTDSHQGSRDLTTSFSVASFVLLILAASWIHFLILV